MKKMNYPCPCGGKIGWKRGKVTIEGVDCGILNIEYCEKCGEEYLPGESMDVVEDKLKKANLWGVKRKEIKFWKSGNSITIRLPTDFSRDLGLDKIKKGYIYREGENKLAIDY